MPVPRTLPPRWTTEGFYARRDCQPDGKRKMSSDKVRELWERHRAGESTVTMAAETGVAYQTLHKLFKKLDYMARKGV